MSIVHSPAQGVLEADMLRPVAVAASQFLTDRKARQPHHVLFELQAVEGVPDIVVASLDDEAIEERHRLGLGPVTSGAQCLTARALREFRDGVTATRLSDYVRLSVGHLRESVLPALEEAGYVQRDASTWRPSAPFRPLARWLVAVEVKRRAWREAVSQARRYLRFSNRTFIALEGPPTKRLGEQFEALRVAGIGLAFVESLEEARVVTRPKWTPPASKFDAHLVGERAWHLVANGATSGPIRPVFGRQLLATAGADPRLVGAGGLIRL